MFRNMEAKNKKAALCMRGFGKDFRLAATSLSLQR